MFPPTAASDKGSYISYRLAHSIRTVERQQLLRSMTPLYLGWVRGFVDDVRELDGDGTEARVEELCGWFEREKRYGIARWRWPDGLAPSSRGPSTHDRWGKPE